eukprot:TRINITY_DN1936_c5_g1_i1.p1 TRINITY_DN1936_c5_g1~~TRINITY_DN1936_c5_g1_i1.p1  ORF type:complete len:888 (+),score=280.09 TRINITY_DN1936_c5_g1_i1:57-2720(+)
MPGKKKKSGADSVQVAIRVRPHTFTDGGDNRDCLSIDDKYGEVCAKDPDGKRAEKTYAFDTVFPTTAEQKDVFDAIGAPMVDTVLDGYNTTLFTYGQTGSGKTYTIQGLPGAGVRMGQDYDIEKHKGLTPRIAEYLLEKVGEVIEEDSTANAMIEMAYLEIYNENVRDLLTPNGKSESLEVREDAKKKPFVQGLTWKKTINSEQILKHLLLGNTRRQTAATKMNEVSSRSHGLVSIRVKIKYDPPNVKKPDTEGLLYIVDLAGSERQDKTGAEGDTLNEAKNINKSLLMLGRAIHAFGEKGANAHVPLRDSKLTRLLKESFGGNSRTWMIATCSASPYNMVETKSTLDYAANAKLITNNAEQNRMARQLELGEQKELNIKLEAEIAELNDKLANANAKAEAKAKAMALEMAKEENSVFLADMDELKKEIEKLKEENRQAKETEEELRHTIAKGLSSDVADQLRAELDAMKAENSKLKKENEEQAAAIANGKGAGVAAGGAAAAASSQHLRARSPTGMGKKKLSRQMNDLLDDPLATPEERIKRMEGRALIESAGSFVRKKSFNDMYQQATGAAPRGSWGANSAGGHRYASVSQGSNVADLNKAKQRAIENEDFTEAQRLTEEIKAMQATPKVSLEELMNARQRAIASEDFTEAQKIQAQINSLKMQQGQQIASTPREPQMMGMPGHDVSQTPRSLGQEDLTMGGTRQVFIGRASISLRFLVQGNSPTKYFTLPLEYDSGIRVDSGAPPQLLVSIYQLDKKGKPDDGRMDFVVHVLQAKGIPKAYCNAVHCKYVFKWGEKDYYKSNEVKMSTDPEFDYKKRYAFPQLTEQLYGWFTSENVMTFEVIGLGASGNSAPAGGHHDPMTGSSGSLDPRDAGPPTGRRSGPYY